MQTNKQFPEPKDRASGAYLTVQEIWRTIQGEGPFVGMPATFIRLAGCNLQCPMCDTDYTSNKQKMHISDIYEKARLCEPRCGLVVITGGEPFRQNIGDLVRLLMSQGDTVQIETNGTLYQEGLPYGKFTIVCSPKTSVINHQLRPYINALKYVVQAGHVDESDGLPTMVLGYDHRVARPLGFDLHDVYVQPADEQDEVKNAANLKAALDSCMKFGYRFCLQTHKLLGMS
jgi:7-carboxy-7-deazaguanine synthase